MAKAEAIGIDTRYESTPNTPTLTLTLALTLTLP